MKASVFVLLALLSVVMVTARNVHRETDERRDMDYPDWRKDQQQQELCNQRRSEGAEEPAGSKREAHDPVF
ncbi:hypothetical protein C0Q70_21056 [Pomacea canaliculata]|uniref:Uncharacterized protein n=2 Tax=Pomacea canaliculata TaxID=400727 RepID=A0A2T7NBG6_POMCA|nr:hypothetical protein C0Q70_21056 [Pomacea canaliculata]